MSRRPEKDELVERNILPDSSAAPGIQGQQRELEKHMRQNSLEKALQSRPEKDELVKDGILKGMFFFICFCFYVSILVLLLLLQQNSRNKKKKSGLGFVVVLVGPSLGDFVTDKDGFLAWQMKIRLLKDRPNEKLVIVPLMLQYRYETGGFGMGRPKEGIPMAKKKTSVLVVSRRKKRDLVLRALCWNEAQGDRANLLQQ